MNDLTTKDLMIGDWFHITHGILNLPDTNGRILTIGNSNSIGTTEGIVDISKIKPIELTREFMEDSFRKYAFNSEFVEYMLSVEGEPDIWRIWENPNFGYIAGTLVIDDFGAGVYEPCVPIRYVHELQHFLKTIKVNIEIEL